jgi:hypothetical protein
MEGYKANAGKMYNLYRMLTSDFSSANLKKTKYGNVKQICMSMNRQT